MSDSRVQTGAAALLYLAYAVFVVTWPVAADLDGRLFGDGNGDLAGAIAHARLVVEERIFPFAPATLHGFNVPFGTDEQWVLNWATFPGTAMLYGLSFVVGAVAAHTLFMLIGFVASGTAMFLLARRITGSAAAAVVTGFAFAFYPFAVGKGIGHLHFLHGWVLVLVAWRFLELIERPTRRNGLLAGLAGALAMWFTPYFLLIAGVEVAVLAIVAVAVGAARGSVGRHVRSVAWVALPIATLLGGLATLTLLAGSGDAGGLQVRSMSELTQYSARLHEFVVPDHNNLLVGARTRPYLEERLHGSNFSENALYLGWSVILLALAGAVSAGVALWRRRGDALREHVNAGALAAAAMAAAGLGFSAPPQLTVFGHLIPMPAWFVFQITSTWRVYSRFVVLIMLGLCLLAAIGLARALRGRSRSVQAAALAALAVIVPLDLWARPENPVTQISPPPVYSFLRDQPPGALIEYPLHPASYPSYSPMFWQAAHGKPIFQGFASATEDEARKLELDDPMDREAAPELAAYGVRYALVHKPSYPEPPALAGHGYRRLYSDDVYELWQVTARPATTMVDALGEFALPEGGSDQHYRWLAYPEGTLYVKAACRPCSGRLEFLASSHERPRRLEVIGAGGQQLHEQVIPPADTRVSVPLRFDGPSTRVRLRISPGPDEIPIAPPSRETRRVGIAVREPRFTPAG